MIKATWNMFSKSPSNLILFVTTRCNFRCKSCFYWRSLGEDEMTIEELEKVLSNLPKIKSIGLSGGEPFMRKDLEEVVNAFVSYGAEAIGIPTNASLDIVPRIENILEDNPTITFWIIISLDGLEKENDFMRMKGSFKKAIRTLKELLKIRDNYPNLRIQIGTTIADTNYKRLPEFVEFIKRFNVNSHTFDWIRGEHQKIINLPKENLDGIDKIRIEVEEYYNGKEKKGFLKSFSNLRFRKVIETQRKALENKRWDYKCLAGKVELVVEANGDLKICELLPAIGNLKYNSYDNLIKSEKAKELFKNIKEHKCDCSHICFVTSSLNHSPLALLKSKFTTIK